MTALTSNTSRYTWLTSEFLENILKSSENNQNVKVTDFVLHDAVPKGENYGSYLIRVTLNYTDGNAELKKTTFVIKTETECDEMLEKFKNSGLFDKEIAFYRDIMPKFQSYANLIDKNFLCAPKCYTTGQDPSYIVFEDLKPQNYRNLNRQKGFDFNATAMLLRKLAKLHAINAMIYEQSPELFKPHNVRLVTPDNLELITVFTSGMENMKKVCVNWPGFEHFGDKFEPLLSKTLEIVESIYSKDDTTFNTLIHGDLWVNNIMYQFDEQSNSAPIDVRMVDFQCGYYGPPAIDLCNLFYGSTANDVTEQDWDRLLIIYHKELVSALNSLEYPSDRIPSLTELQIQMLRKSLIAVMISLVVVPARHIDSSTTAPELSDILSTGESSAVLKLFDKPEVCERLKYLMDFYYRKGFF